MIQIAYLRENKSEVINRLSVKNFDATQLADEILDADEQRRTIQKELDAVLSYQNQLAKEVGEFFKKGMPHEAQEAKEKSAALKDTAKELGDKMAEAEKRMNDLLVRLPNMPHASVPKGKTPEDNEVVFCVKEIPTLPPSAKPHWELTNQYDIIDFELGVKITGAGFPVYKGKGARLQRALINFFLDHAISNGYAEIQPPIFINEDSGFGTGQLPDKEGQMYHIGADNFYLIPTAEVPVTNIFRDVILKTEQLPQKLTAYTPCFRREAGSYGKDVRGLNRLHQFDKVEIVQITEPEKSYQTLEDMRMYVASILEKLELPYRTLKLCGGDMSFASALTYDMEVYSAAQKRWLEVSSVSNFETFQSNRLKLRYRKGNDKPQLTHTLNGSALALPRIVAALLENNQTEKGIKIPSVLVPYTGFEFID